MNTTTRVLIAAVGAVLLAVAAGVYVLNAREGRAAVDLALDPAPVVLTDPGRILFRNTAPGPHEGVVASVARSDPRGPRRVSTLRCERFSTAAGTGLCVRPTAGVTPQAEVVLVDASLSEIKSFRVAGTVSRARLSPDGRIAAWTTFVTGDAYNSASFSTRTGVYDREQDKLLTNLESLRLTLGGQIHLAEDVNYWGVTFTPDNRTFYATVSTGGRTHLVRTDYAAWEAEAVRENVECPSLSPDGRRLAFKKRIDSDETRPWRIHILDLATMTETPVAEPAGIDDQVGWLDENTLVYGLADGNLHTARADGVGAAGVLVEWASSPTGTPAG
ncbi:hypothetical protein JOF53_002223 [Crossiella equi]|uniref:Translocation protein TolB n=1 Tax=Crossiella equi TaxID=130796 RepID=A0ABS5A9V6_9PSEU|nr:PD40 domain-containing protein [Crossiella equi]MBP2473351.1 hypothetical protein [Crossiella equi]